MERIQNTNKQKEFHRGCYTCFSVLCSHIVIEALFPSNTDVTSFWIAGNYFIKMIHCIFNNLFNVPY